MKRLGLILLLPALAFGEIGTPTARYPLPVDQPFGLAALGGNLLIADRATGKLLTFSLAEKKIVGSAVLPCDQPMGIASDGAGLWISDKDNKRLLHFIPAQNKVDKVLGADLEADVTGVGWDGTALWVTSAGRFLKLDPSDGTEMQTFVMGPGMDATGVFYDGTYLWITERQRNMIAVATPQGEVFGFLPSPGPYPAGIVRVGNDLWVVDFQDRTLCSLSIGPTDRPFYAGEPHRRGLRFQDALINHGPSSDVTGKIYECCAVEDVHQRILKAPAFSPAPSAYVSDLWDQKFAVAEGKIPALKDLSLAFDVQVETRDINYFLLPEWVQPLDSIPAGVLEKYLRDGSKLKIHDPFIQALSGEIVGGEKNPFWIAFKIHKYLHSTLTYQMSGGWNDAPTVLRRGNGSCSEFTFAFLALARASGLPARYEAGMVVRGDDASIDRDYHRWVQVYLPPFGWIPVDPSSGKPTTAADIARSFGSLSQRFFITTHSGGDSPYLGWTYNYKSFYEFVGKAEVDEKNEAKWSPAKE